MITELQKNLLNMPQVEIETKHIFSAGIYAREIIIPKGVCLVGAKHKTEHLYTVSRGKCLFGEQEINAPFTGITMPGTKRAIYALEDTVMTTYHVTNETDISKIESEIIEPEGLKIANNKELIQ